MSTTRNRIDNSGTTTVDPTQHYLYRNSPSGGWTSTSSSNNFSDFWSGVRKTMTDVVTKRFKARSLSGEVIVNPMSSTITKRRMKPGSFHYQYPGGGYYEAIYSEYYDHWKGMHNGASYYPNNHIDHDIDINSLKKLAGTDALAAMSSSPFEGLVFLAELRETIAFARRPHETFLKLLRNWRKKSRNKGVSLLEMISENWLAWRYAVRPVIMDLNGVLDALEAMKKAAPERVTARGFASTSSTEIMSETSPNGEFTRERTTKTTVEVRSGILFEPDYRDLFGVSPLKLPIAAWELIPFSFIADWIVNVGSYISAITPKIGVKVLGQWTTVKVITHTTVRLDRIGLASPRIILSQSPSYEYITTEEVNREPGIQTGLTFEPLPLDFLEDHKAKRVIDLIALSLGAIRTILESKKRRQRRRK